MHLSTTNHEIKIIMERSDFPQKKNIAGIYVQSVQLWYSTQQFIIQYVLVVYDILYNKP